AIRLMSTLNRAAAEAMATVEVHACTDVTGFGLLGHLRNMALASACSAVVQFQRTPVLDAARVYVREGIAPGGTHAHWRFLAEWTAYAVDKPDQLLVCDAQTSGGLLIAVAPSDAEKLCAELRARGTPCAAIVGALEAGRAGRLRVER